MVNGNVSTGNRKTLKLFNILLVYYFASRYPDKREKIRFESTEENIKNIFKQTKEVYSWLKSKL